MHLYEALDLSSFWLNKMGEIKSVMEIKARSDIVYILTHDKDLAAKKGKQRNILNYILFTQVWHYKC